MDDSQIEQLFELMGRTTRSKRDCICQLYLGCIGEGIVPFCARYYRSSRSAEFRAALIGYVIQYGRCSHTARVLAIESLSDRSKHVRRSGCAVLAYSLDDTMLPYLQELTRHRDLHTQENARRATEAIINKNINLFVDPMYAAWIIVKYEEIPRSKEDIDYYIVKNAPELVQPISSILGTVYPDELC